MTQVLKLYKTFYIRVIWLLGGIHKFFFVSDISVHFNLYRSVYSHVATAFHHTMEEKDAETFGDGSSSVASRALRRDGVMMAQCAHSDSDDDCENYYIGFLSEFDKESSSNGSVGDGSESRSRAVFGEDDDGPLPLDSLCRSWLDDACSSSAADGGGDGEMPAGGRVYPSQPIVSRVQLMQNAVGAVEPRLLHY